MRIERIVNHPMDVNTYLVIKDKHCLVVDPSFNDQEIIRAIDDENLTVDGVILTHAHFDHLISVNTICLMYDVPLYVHAKEVEALYDGSKNLSQVLASGKGIVVDNRVSVHTVDEQTKSIGDFHFSIFHVPGHSPGSIALYFKEAQKVIVGDALFNRSIGRTDLIGGDEAQLLRNIKKKLLILKDETIVYPGHGQLTTIGNEKLHNPFIR